MSTGTIITLYMLGAAATVAVVKLLVTFSTAEDSKPRVDPKQPIPAELLRALVIHSQWLYIIGSLVGVPWPATLLYPMQVIGGIWSSTSGSSIGIECILPSSSNLPVAMQKMLIRLVTPAGILMVVLSIDFVMHVLRPRTTARAGQGLASVVMCIAFMFMPVWVSTVLSMFTCIPLDAPIAAPYQAAAIGNFWLEDMSQKCYSSSSYHKWWALGLGIPLTFLFCVVMPAGVFGFMWYSRKQGKLGNKQFQKQYGFMYRLWREEVCWWESMFLLQTIALVIVSTFGFALGAFYQSLVATAVLALVAHLLQVVRPFKCRAANKVAVSSVYVLLLTAYTALTFLPYNNFTPGPVYGNIMGVVILLANLAFLGSTTYKLIRAVDWAVVISLLTKAKPWLSKGCCGPCSPAPANQAPQESTGGQPAAAPHQHTSSPGQVVVEDSACYDTVSQRSKDKQAHAVPK